MTTATVSEDFYTPLELARRLSVSERKIRGLLATGEIPSYKVGTMRRIAPEDFKKYLERNRNPRRTA